MTRRTLVCVSPHPVRGPSLPTRPACLVSAFIEAGAFEEVIVVNRLRPTAFVSQATGGRPIAAGGRVGASRRLATGATLVEHPWPFGRLERRFLRGWLATTVRQSSGGVAVWVADPKSVPAVVGADGDSVPWQVIDIKS